MPNSSQTKADVILQAALEQFAENGFHCSPISQLAALAGVGVGSIYRYFKDKDELVHAVFARVDATLRNALVQALDDSLSDQQQFVQLVTQLMHYLRVREAEFKFLEQYYSSPYGIEKKQAKFLSSERDPRSNPFINFFTGDKRGIIKDLPLSLCLSMTFGPIIFLLRDSFAGLVQLDDTLIQQTAEACWNALKA
ncbi:MAG: TetR/AcrR family transcriptional regulator [Desulfuromonadales bacterium]|nr:TetR/AcrR family transcriptional regulator [Desulfuromonadales bacterium]